ncbi:hypothetical protein MY04_1195 [Flammeovirga sp. MY04]|uniref:hypothetical protein n=1 Tax=Flammeovirga sp. MY04 TaxID=1191459 RepID=UPI0008062B77|nr:hypothetical protein [Flammeovirga sp. MY04]ANQ48572.1 hypothetical protein MY04_1195 [Flammeovirga sp. MY04]
MIFIESNEITLEVSLDNTRKNYNRDKDISHIHHLVETIEDYVFQSPDWEIIKDNVLISLFPSEYKINDILYDSITDQFNKGYVYYESPNISMISNQ